MAALRRASKVCGYLDREKNKVLDKMLRVDHAGELGADRIYYGQNFVLGGDKEYGPAIQHMWNQEKAHLEEMEYLNLKYRSRKSIFEPFWSLGGFVLGSTTALIGPKAAMACTMAVEETITSHYNDQIRDIIAEGELEKLQYLLEKLTQFRDDEQEHHDKAEAFDGKQEERLFGTIRAICKTSIKIAEKL